jgi:hypothetical protein
MKITNAVATTVMSYEADGQLVIDATCTSLTVVVRGNCSITDNGTTTSLTEDAAISRTGLHGGDHALDTDSNGRIRIVDGAGVGEINTNAGRIVQVESMLGTITTLDGLATANAVSLASGLSSHETNIIAEFTTIKGATWASGTDTLEEIRDRGDSAWITATGFSTHNAANVWSVATRQLTATGLDLVLVDGKNLPNALEIIAAGVIGKISGAGTGTEVFVGLDEATTRATVTVDASGNRSAVTYV